MVDFDAETKRRRPVRYELTSRLTTTCNPWKDTHIMATQKHTQAAPAASATKGIPRPNKRQAKLRHREGNVIFLGARLKSCNGFFQDRHESAHFKAGDVVMLHDGYLAQIAGPYGEYHTREHGMRYGYVLKRIEDDGHVSFYPAGALLTPSGKVRHLSSVPAACA